mmetsp:Transcript_7370/g.9147  ORF Transcript_7370/g.9147 Transcript_7370/m.9147 type:complete len:166 (+) Transcript_7370:122-619(+)
MYNIQGYSSESDSDNSEKKTNVTQLKSLKLFNNEGYTKNKISLQQPLHIDFRENNREENDGQSSDADVEIDAKSVQDTKEDSDKSELSEPIMTEFNTRKFYEENTKNQEKYEGQLKSNQPLKQLSNIRLHQLSNIIKLGQANEAKLHELHKGNKVHKPKALRNKK